MFNLDLDDDAGALPAWLWAAVIVALALLTWGLFVAGKHLSYAWMYEDMVRGTVTEMVKAGALQ